MPGGASGSPRNFRRGWLISTWITARRWANSPRPCSRSSSCIPAARGRSRLTPGGSSSDESPRYRRDSPAQPQSLTRPHHADEGSLEAKVDDSRRITCANEAQLRIWLPTHDGLVVEPTLLKNTGRRHLTTARSQDDGSGRR